jgi:hypothetical protein
MKNLPRKPANSTSDLQYVFVGDKAFALCKHILKPFIQKQLTNERRPWFNLQLDALNSCLFTYNIFIKILYMFRALTLLIIRRSTS